MVLVGNKADLAEKREIETSEGQELASKNKMLFFECSAKTGFNIDEVFYESARGIAKKIKDKYYDLSSEVCGIKIGIGSNDANRASHVLTYEDKKATKNKKKGCC